MPSSGVCPARDCGIIWLISVLGNHQGTAVHLPDAVESIEAYGALSDEHYSFFTT